MNRKQYFVDVADSSGLGYQHITDDLPSACIHAMKRILVGDTINIWTAEEGFFEDPDGYIQSTTPPHDWDQVAQFYPQSLPRPANPVLQDFDGAAWMASHHCTPKPFNPQSQLSWFDTPDGKPPGLLKKQAD